jgi:WhiB family redox-sensing transcriptional regulator
MTSTLSPVSSTTWRSRSACEGLDPDIFYPASEDDAASAPAKSICETCPVKEPCLEHALNNREREGVWGGMTERERRRMVRQRRKTV